MINILILLIEGICYFLIRILKVHIPCLFKSLTNMPCPGCGLTRSILSLLDLDIVSSFKYNILGIPLSIFFLILDIYLIYDLICKKNKTKQYLNKVFSYYYILIILLILSEIINIYHY